MITFKEEDGCFMYRVAGVIIHNNKILLQRGNKDNSWVLPGGRAEISEVSIETIKREMKEELNIDVQVKRLLWVVENFDAYKVLRLHELGLYYLIDLVEPQSIFETDNEFIGIEKSEKLIFRWHTLDKIDSLDIYPVFLRTALKNIPSEIKHIVNRDS